jgi:hypothetical protein
MTERESAIDETTFKFGLLMESAQAHQKLAEANLEQLRAHTRDLDGVVRDEIRRTLIEELQMVASESKRAMQALQQMRRGTSLRVGLFCLGIALLASGVPLAWMRWTLPSQRELAALRARRDELAAGIESLERRGGHIAWRRCGESAQLCVRIDLKSKAYGEKADFYVVADH